MEKSSGRSRGLKLAAGVVVALGVAGVAQAQSASFPAMAPIEQYRMAQDAEVEMARSAAPASVAHDAEVLVLGAHGLETAVKGTNGFTCLVLRSWADHMDDPEFWNPKARSPICLNAAAVRFYLPHYTKKTEWVLAGLSKAQIAEKLNAAFDSKELTPPEPGAMSYMMSKQGHLNEQVGHWHPHLMFYAPSTDAKAWGANLPGSPLLADTDPAERMTTFMLTVDNWSDGTAGPAK